MESPVEKKSRCQNLKFVSVLMGLHKVCIVCFDQNLPFLLFFLFEIVRIGYNDIKGTWFCQNHFIGDGSLGPGKASERNGC